MGEVEVGVNMVEEAWSRTSGWLVLDQVGKLVRNM